MDNNIEKFGSVFEAGEVIYVKHDAFNEPILCIIEKVDDNCINFRLPIKFSEKNILTGDIIYCHILKRDYEYVIMGEISNIAINPPGMVQVTIDKYNKHKNNRVFVRYSISLPGNLSIPGSQSEHFIIVNNISILGVAFNSKEKLDIGQTVGIRINTMTNADLLELSARVLRKTDKETFYEYGLEISDIDIKNRDTLERLLFSLNQNEENLIENLKKPVTEIDS